jgi:nuclear GTP-binding protein
MDYAVQAAEAKARRKEEKKNRAQQNFALETGGKDGDDDGSRDQGSDDAEGEKGGFDGVATLAGPTKNPSKSTKGVPATSGASASALASATEASGAQLLLNPDLPHLAAVLDKADVVIEVLDARDPLAHRSHALEARVASKEGQKLLLVLNKIGACAHTPSDVRVVIADRSTVDACPREPTAAWAAQLRSEHPTLLFRAASSFLPPVVTSGPTKGKAKSKEPLDDAWGLDAVSKLLGQWAQEKTGDGPLHAAVVGLTNVRSCSFIFSPGLNAGYVVGKERIHKFAYTQIHARHLCAFLKHQQPDNYATRPRSDTRIKRCIHRVHRHARASLAAF